MQFATILHKIHIDKNSSLFGIFQWRWGRGGWEQHNNVAMGNPYSSVGKRLPQLLKMKMQLSVVYFKKVYTK